jgi:hypothetical protein
VPRSDIATCCLFSKQQEHRAAHLEADIVGIPNVPNLWLVRVRRAGKKQKNVLQGRLYIAYFVFLARYFI